jgi:hypothetical protein
MTLARHRKPGCRILAIHGGKRPFDFIAVCTPHLVQLDPGAVDTAFARLLESKAGPLCYGLIYQEIRSVCAERGLLDPDDGIRTLFEEEDSVLDLLAPNSRVN